MNELYDLVEKWYSNNPITLDVDYSKKNNYLKSVYYDQNNNIADEERSFKVEKLNFIEGFVINTKDTFIQVTSEISFKLIGITKDLPPSTIKLEYVNCRVRYKRDNTAEAGYFYRGNLYVPQEQRLLRYSLSGIVTEDYVVCRITLYTDRLTVEKEILVPCFYRGTEILTDQGRICVEKLSDKNTIRGEKIKKIVKATNNTSRLVYIRQNTFGTNKPDKAVIVTENHLVKFNKKWMPAYKLQSDGISIYPPDGKKVYNILLDKYSYVDVCGLIMETLQPMQYSTSFL